MRRLKSSVAFIALSTLGALLALCIPVAQAGASVPSTWHLGQVNIGEIEKETKEPIGYASSGTVTVKFSFNEPIELANCQAHGSGTLSGKSELTVEKCKAYVNGTRKEECDPLPFTINFSATMESERFVIQDHEICIWVAEETEWLPGQMNLEAGAEGFSLKTTINEETRVGFEKSGSISGSLNMSLKSPFQGRSFGAGPAPLVHINGKTFAELGITKEAFGGFGHYTIEIAGIATYSCEERAEGELHARGNSLDREHLFGCVVVGQTKCKVEPFEFNLYGSWEKGSNILTTIRTTGCTVYEEMEILYPERGYMNYGSEGSSLEVQSHAVTHFGTHTVTLSGTTNWQAAFGTLGIW